MTGLVDKFLLFSARLNKNYPDSDVNSYFAILFSILFGYVYCFKKRDIGLIAYAILALYCMLTEFDSPTTHVIIFWSFCYGIIMEFEIRRGRGRRRKCRKNSNAAIFAIRPEYAKKHSGRNKKYEYRK